MLIIIIFLLLLLVVCVCYLFHRYHQEKERKLLIRSNLVKTDFILDQYCEWMRKIASGEKIEQPLLDENIKRVGIYGVGRIGTSLEEYLPNAGIQVVCGIDMNPDKAFTDLKMYGLNDELPDLDAIIVTPTYAFGSIKKALSKVTTCKIISVDDLIFG